MSQNSTAFNFVGRSLIKPAISAGVGAIMLKRQLGNASHIVLKYELPFFSNYMSTRVLGALIGAASSVIGEWVISMSTGVKGATNHLESLSSTVVLLGTAVATWVATPLLMAGPELNSEEMISYAVTGLLAESLSRVVYETFFGAEASVGYFEGYI